MSIGINKLPKTAPGMGQDDTRDGLRPRITSPLSSVRMNKLLAINPNGFCDEHTYEKSHQAYEYT